MIRLTEQMAPVLFKTGLQFASGVLVDEYMDFESPISISDNCLIQRSKIGAYTYIMNGTQLDRTNIGRYCSVARNVLCVPTQKPFDWLTTSPVLYHGQMFSRESRLPQGYDFDDSNSIEIGHDVWIGANAVIMGGVSIGIGSVVGANSVVTRSVEPYSIIGGTPARQIRKRFDERTIERLMVLKWTDYNVPEILRSNLSPDFRVIDDNFFDRFSSYIETSTIQTFSPSKHRLYQRPDGKAALHEISR